MTNVSVDFIAGRDSVTPALRKMQEQVDRLTQKNQKLADASKKAGGAGARGLNTMIKSAASAAIGYVSLSKAIGLVNDELQRQTGLQEKATGISKSVGTLQREVGALLGISASAEDRLKFLADVKDVAGERGQRPFLEAAKAGLSATKGQSGLVLETLRSVKPFTLGDDTLARRLTSFVPGVATAAGISTDDAAALSFAALQVSRIEETAQLPTIGPALAAARLARGGGETQLDAARNAIALNAVFGGNIQDISGPKSARATGGFLSGLERAAPSARTFDERLAAVRRDPALIQEVLKTGFIGATRDVAKGLLEGKGGGFLEQEFREVRGGLTLDRAGLQSLAEFSTGGVGSTPEIRALRRETEAEGTTEQFVGRSRLELQGAIRRRLREGLTEAGTQTGFATRGLTEVRLGGVADTQGQIDFARSIIAQELGRLGGTGSGLFDAPIPRQISEEGAERIERLRKTERQLDGIERELRAIRNNQAPVRASSEVDE